MVLYKVSQGLLSLMAARAVGIEIGWLEIFAVYTFGELLSTIPLTPGGVGFVEAGSAGLLVSFGAPNEAALAAVLLYRAFTYLFEIPLGGVGWLTWATRTSWREPVGTMTADRPRPAVPVPYDVTGSLVHRARCRRRGARPAQWRDGRRDDLPPAPRERSASAVAMTATDTAGTTPRRSQD